MKLFIQFVGTSLKYRIQQVENDKCRLEYCLTASNQQCIALMSQCNFTLSTISLALTNNDNNISLLLHWVPVSKQAGDVVISNYEVSVMSI